MSVTTTFLSSLNHRLQRQLINLTDRAPPLFALTFDFDHHSTQTQQHHHRPLSLRSCTEIAATTAMRSCQPLLPRQQILPTSLNDKPHASPSIDDDSISAFRLAVDKVSPIAWLCWLISETSWRFRYSRRSPSPLSNKKQEIRVQVLSNPDPISLLDLIWIWPIP